MFPRDGNGPATAFRYVERYLFYLWESQFNLLSAKYLCKYPSACTVGTASQSICGIDNHCYVVVSHSEATGEVDVAAALDR